LTPTPTDATVQPSAYGLTLDAYAEAKRLPAEFLKRHGVEQFTWSDGHPYLKMAYFAEDGSTPVGARLRHAIDEPCKWGKGNKAQLYGLPELAAARQGGQVVICEGESDWQTLHYHEVPALAVPGASTWKPAWDDYLEGFETIYIVIEPDRGGQAMQRWVARSRARDRMKLIFMSPEPKDPSALHIDDAEAFAERWAQLVAQAVPWSQIEQREVEDNLHAAREAAAELARHPNILEALTVALHDDGLVGEARATKLVYLCATSRLLPQPVSAVMKGPSSAGKSFIVNRILDNYFPPEAYHILTAMSDRALIYSDVDLRHRVLVLHEAAGLGELAEYFVRSYQSEGHLRYETVEATAEGIRPRVVEKEGPVCLLLTTTAVGLHTENETRLFSIPVSDSPDQTKAIFRAQAREDEPPRAKYEPWRALQRVLAGERLLVTVPYRAALAELTRPTGVRMRRDFKAVLNLIRAHALLQSQSRDRDDQGSVVASLADYAVVHELTADLISEGVQASVPRKVRETVEAVEALLGGGNVTVARVAGHLGLDKSSASRRVAAALQLDYLVNRGIEGGPARLDVGEPMPAELLVLPSPEQVEGCTVALAARGTDPPSPLADDLDEVEEAL
jgi:hypothetical protein